MLSFKTEASTAACDLWQTGTRNNVDMLDNFQAQNLTKLRTNLVTKSNFLSARERVPRVPKTSKFQKLHADQFSLLNRNMQVK